MGSLEPEGRNPSFFGNNGESNTEGVIGSLDGVSSEGRGDFPCTMSSKLVVSDAIVLPKSSNALHVDVAGERLVDSESSSAEEVSCSVLSM